MLKKSNILIFADDAEAEGGLEKIIDLKNFLRNNGINRVILVNLEHISQKLIDSRFARVIVEEVRFLEKNPGKMPIIFYGQNSDDYLAFVKSCDWYGRPDMTWVRNPYEQIEDLKNAIDKADILRL